jgi:DICT domain-containing protein
MVYLQEASRYRDLAERARDQLEKREKERLAPQ